MPVVNAEVLMLMDEETFFFSKTIFPRISNIVISLTNALGATVRLFLVGFG